MDNMNKGNKILLWLFFIISFVVIVILSVIAYNKFYKNGNNDKMQENVDVYEDESLVNVVSEDVEETQAKKEEEKVPVSYKAAIPIYMYHWIKDDTGDYPWPENMVKISAMREQVEYLVNNNFELIWITDLDKIYNYEKPVALTFDDGWEDVYFHMFPLAKEYKVKFSMYIIKDMVGQPGYCTEDEIKEMIDSGFVDIQSHTVTHPYLANLTYAQQESQLVDSKKYLKDEYGVDSTVICYPYGSRNENTVTISKEAGYKYGLDMDGGVYYTDVNTDPLKIPRIYATRSMDITTFANYANKSYVDVVWNEE